MELTKEECTQALIELTPNPLGIYSEDVTTIRQLIKDHFDNPPLKFEELKGDMWVWDDEKKAYIFIYKLHIWEPVKGIRYSAHRAENCADCYYMDYEDNRFYHYEVQDD